MNKYIILLYLFTFSNVASFAQSLQMTNTCDCALGWPPSCDVVCGPKIISLISDNQFRNIFKLSSTSVTVIHNQINQGHLTLDQLYKKLDPSEYRKLVNGINMVNGILRKSQGNSELYDLDAEELKWKPLAK
jgi:hypothetical protein